MCTQGDSNRILLTPYCKGGEAVGSSLLLDVDEGSVVDTLVHDHVEMGKLLVIAERRSARV